MRVISLAPRWFFGCVLASLCLLATLSWSQGFPEPAVVFYGKVFQSAGGTTLDLREGRLEVTFVSESNPSNRVSLASTLGRRGAGGEYSYVLEVPMKFLPRAYELDEVLAVGASPSSYRLENLSVNGVEASTADPAVSSFSPSFTRRAAQTRLDLKVSLPEIDSDSDGLPDWWERQHGLSVNFPDGDQDPDNDGRNNLREFQDGTDPNQASTIPLVRVSPLKVPEAGRAGLMIGIFDSDTPPDQLRLTMKQIPSGFVLEHDGAAMAVGQSFTASDLRGGRLTVYQKGPAVGAGDLSLEVKDPANPALPFTVPLSVLNPTTLAGVDPTLWLEALALGTPVGGAVAEWADRSGLSNTVWQTDTTRRPVVAVVDGKRGVQFGGTQRHLLFEDRALPLGPLTVFTVYHVPADGGRQQVLAANRLALSVEERRANGTNSGVQRWANVSLTATGRADVRGRRIVSEATLGTGTNVTYAGGGFDGEAETSTATSQAMAPALGIRRLASGPESGRYANPFTGLLHEFIAIPGPIDAGARHRLRDYLAARWSDAIVWDASESSSPVVLRGDFSPVVLRGGAAEDQLDGGDGDDRIVGGPGDDQLSGGAGADTFVYAPGDTGNDTIADFEMAGDLHDRLDFDEIFESQHGQALDHLEVRVESVRVGNDLVPQTVVSVKVNPAGPSVCEVTLTGLALSAADLPDLLARQVIQVGALELPPLPSTPTTPVPGTPIRLGVSTVAGRLEMVYEAVAGPATAPVVLRRTTIAGPEIDATSEFTHSVTTGPGGVVTHRLSLRSAIPAGEQAAFYRVRWASGTSQ